MNKAQLADEMDTGILHYKDGKLQLFYSHQPEEIPLTIVVNGQELVTLMCTPTRLNHLVIGFLFLEGIINSVSDLLTIKVCDDEVKASVVTKTSSHIKVLGKQKVINTGCTGRYVSSKNKLITLPVNVGMVISCQQVFNLMKCLYVSAEGYHSTGGLHCSGFSLNGDQLVMAAEDVGRHNTIDKLVGEGLLRDIPLRGGMILTTGRISSEMVLKAANIEVPLLVSRTSPTTLAMELANKFGITLVGYVRSNSLRVYTHSARIKM